MTALVHSSAEPLAHVVDEAALRYISGASGGDRLPADRLPSATTHSVTAKGRKGGGVRYAPIAAKFFFTTICLP